MPGATQVLPADDPAAIARAAAALRAGRLVAFPTETVYGLGAAALDPDAVRRIFAAKERPADNPLIVHVAAAEQAAPLVREVTPAARRLMSFWPGPLTLVLPRAASVPDLTTAGQDTVALRVPAHPAALALLRAAAIPVAAPSANRSGRPSPTTAAHVLADLEGRVDLILDGGPTEVGLESTVVDATREPPLVLRQGGLAIERLRAAGPIALLSGQDPEAMSRSPGLRHRHYAPRARVVLVAAGEAERAAAESGAGAAVMSQRPPAPGFRGRWEVMPADAAGYARALFAALRRLDDEGWATIVVEAVDESGLGRAILDRLRRAAAG